MQELQVLNVNNVDYEIADGKARTDITSATLNSTYTQETKTLKISLTTESGQIGG